MELWEQIAERIELPKPEQKVFIWGAGNTSVLNHQGLQRENLYNELGITAFLDSKLAGGSIFGYPVYHPDILDNSVSDHIFVYISTTNYRVRRELEELCKQKNIKNAFLDASILKFRRNEYKKAVNLFDHHSRAVYQSVLANRAEAIEPGEELFSGESYFGIPEFCRCSPKDVVLDCGAYVGDSAERYIWRMEQFKKYIAIEPDKSNYQALQQRFERLKKEWNIPEEKLVMMNAGVDERSHLSEVKTRVEGLGSIADEDSYPSDSGIPFWAVDDLMSEPFTFLKADIESYEYRMLCGARESIRKYHPRMAICIYHNMVDMYSIPLLIHEIEPSYHMSVRHHSYGYEETVLYAY